MDRWACVSVAALPLQLVLRKNPDWAKWPAVVVSEDKPQGTVLWLNEHARREGARAGQSYAVALSLAQGLRAAAVAEAQISEVIAELKTELWRFSPNVEIGEEQGVFWLDASGLSRLYPQLERWAQAVRERLRHLSFVASVVVGFSRFGTYAVARASHGNRVFEHAEEESLTVGRVPLAHLDLDPALFDVLHKLGVHCVADFLQLPAAGLLPRFGKSAYRLHQLAAGDLFSALVPSPWLAPLHERALLDEAESDATRLLFVIKRLLSALLSKLVLRGEALCALMFSVKLDRSQGRLGPEELRPAVPTLDVVQLMDLVRLRIETLQLGAGVIEIELEAQGISTTPEQLRVFAEQPRRDLAAANRALARLRAELGEDAVACAVLRPGHLPEACFAWQPVSEVRMPCLQIAAADGVVRLPSMAYEVSALASLARKPLIRRLFRVPEVLGAPPRRPRDDGWLIRGAFYGAVTHSAGPFIVSGGWWIREAHRDYHFVLTQRGDLLWVYHDRRRRQFCLHAELQ